MAQKNGVRRSHENLFNYINLNLFSNKLAIGLCDYEQTGSKPSDIDLLFETLMQLFDKYQHWSPVPKYKSIVDNLLNSEEEYQLLTEVLEDIRSKKITKPSELEETIKHIMQNVDKVKEAKKITNSTKASIDYLVKFLIILSNYTVIAQDMDKPLPSSREEVVSVSLK